MKLTVASVAITVLSLTSALALAAPAPPRQMSPRGTAVAKTAAPAPQETTVEGATLAERARKLAALAKELEALCGYPSGTPEWPKVQTKAKTAVADAEAGLAKAPANEQPQEKEERLANERSIKTSAAIAQREIPRLNFARLCSAYATKWWRPALPPAGYRLNIVPLQDVRLAAAALATDPQTAEAVLEDIRNELAPLEGIEQLVGDLAIVARILRAVDTSQQFGAELATSTVGDLASVALAGLARLIADRARYEAIGWFMTQLGEHVCVTEPGNDQTKVRVGREMATHVMPSLCALAKKDQLWEYGAGAALWESFQASVRSDFNGLPGAAAGLASISLADDPALLLGCDEAAASTGANCKLANALRKSTATRLRSLIAGTDATQVLVSWGADLSAAKQLAKGGRMEVLACAVSMPQFLDTWRASFAKEGWYSALALATLTGADNCQHAALGFELGIERDVVLGLVAACDGTTEACVATESSRSERITSLSVHSPWLSQATALEASLRRWVDAKNAFDNAGGEGTSAAITTELQVTADASPKSVTAAVDALARGRVGTAKVDAAFGLADASIDVGLNAIDLLVVLNSRDADALQKSREGLVRVRAAIQIARAAAKGEWGVVVNGTVTFIASDSVLSKSEELKHILNVAKELSSLVTIASAKDPDEMAKAIDALADPPGGWRLKRKPGRTTVSLTAHPGFYVAEETRWGPYGAKVERASVYLQPPTLALPVGLEVSHGYQGPCGSFSLNLLISALDPAAFLAYDVSNEGRLPGPSVLTALAPGLEASISLGNSPFNIGPFLAFRPGYRQWEPDADGAGAHALQVGGTLSVDVTLYSLMSSGGQ